MPQPCRNRRVASRSRIMIRLRSRRWSRRMNEMRSRRSIHLAASPTLATALARLSALLEPTASWTRARRNFVAILEDLRGLNCNYRCSYTKDLLNIFQVWFGLRQH